MYQSHSFPRANLTILKSVCKKAVIFNNLKSKENGTPGRGYAPTKAMHLSKHLVFIKYSIPINYSISIYENRKCTNSLSNTINAH